MTYHGKGFKCYSNQSPQLFGKKQQQQQTTKQTKMHFKELLQFIVLPLVVTCFVKAFGSCLCCAILFFLAKQ